MISEYFRLKSGNENKKEKKKKKITEEENVFILCLVGL